jgi:antirestriction protein ArdC
MSTNKSIDLYQEVTDKIIRALEQGTPPWVCPWDRGHGSVLPANFATGRRYRGINVLLLNLRQIAEGYPQNRWLTYQQAKAIGGHVRRGEEATRVVFFKLLEAEQSTTEMRAHRSQKVIPLLRSFAVFNEAQIEGLTQASDDKRLDELGEPIQAAQHVIDASGAEIHHGGASAFYRPATDSIQMPPLVAFDSAESYYRVALHELTHWTGHASRCNRPLISRQHIEAYAFEELVAEMGAAFLSARCGLSSSLRHASYIDAWLKGLSNDRRMVFSAASMAQKAVDFLLPESEEFAAPAQAESVA